MQVYLVGGAVRDMMMGLEPKDKDYVVVGSTPDEMLSLGYKQVGADFPVFLHPETGEEYALARRERKTGPGYHGFETDHGTDVTLEDDLLRRDLTINSMAMTSNGQLIDPYDGLIDIRDQRLQHTSYAFREDPVRILRTARFAARYGFDVAPATWGMMTRMVMAGEFDHLTPERVWAEFEKGLMEPKFFKLFAVLDSVGALKKIPMYDLSDYEYASFEAAADAGEDLVVRCAAMFHNRTPKQFADNRIPTSISDLASTADACQKFVRGMTSETTRQDVLKFFNHVDIFRRTDRFNKALKVLEYRDQLVGEIIPDWAEMVIAVDAGAIAKTCDNPSQIKEAITKARLEAMCFTK